MTTDDRRVEIVLTKQQALELHKLVSRLPIIDVPNGVCLVTIKQVLNRLTAAVSATQPPSSGG